MKNKGYNTAILVAGILVVATTGLFLLLKPAEMSFLYKFNFGLTLALEIALPLLLAFTKTRNVSTPFYIVVWTYGILFFLFSVGTMLLVHLFAVPGALVSEDIASANSVLSKTYFSILIIATAVVALIATLLYNADVAHKNSVQRQQDERNRQQDLYGNMKFIAVGYQNICTTKMVGDTSVDGRDFHKLADAMKFLTPNVMRNAMAMQKLDEILSRSNELKNAAEAAEGDKFIEVDKSVKRFVQQAVEEIGIVKNMARS